MNRNSLAAAFALATLVGSANAQPPLKKVEEKGLVTKVYDLKALFGEKGKANGLADMDAIIKMILEHLPVGELKPGTDGPQLVDRDGGKLEVRTTAKTQAEIGDLVEAILRLTDFAVDVNAEVIELDVATFDKLVKRLPKSGRGKPGSPVLFPTREETDEKEPTAEDKKAVEEANKILKAGRSVQNSEGRFINGVEATLSARQSVLTFHPNVVNKQPMGPPQFVKEGFRLAGLPVVSADRRFVRLKLTEQSSAVVGIKKRELDEFKGQKIVVETPELEDLGASASAVVPDGASLIFRLAYAPADKVWLVVVKPKIFIRAEE